MAHSLLSDLQKQLQKALALVEVGGNYYHYQNDQKIYKVLNVAIQEATEKVWVIYQSIDNNQITWVRDLDKWLELVENNGTQVKRFQHSKDMSTVG